MRDESFPGTIMRTNVKVRILSFKTHPCESDFSSGFVTLETKKEKTRKFAGKGNSAPENSFDSRRLCNFK